MFWRPASEQREREIAVEAQLYMEIVSLHVRAVCHSELWPGSRLSHHLDIPDTHRVRQDGDSRLLHHQLHVVRLLRAARQTLARDYDDVARRRAETPAVEDRAGQPKDVFEDSENSCRHSHAIGGRAHFVHSQQRRCRLRLSEHQEHPQGLLRPQFPSGLQLLQLLARSGRVRQVHSCDVNVRLVVHGFIHHDDIVRTVGEVQADQRTPVRGQRKGELMVL